MIQQDVVCSEPGNQCNRHADITSKRAFLNPGALLNIPHVIGKNGRELVYRRSFDRRLSHNVPDHLGQLPYAEEPGPVVNAFPEYALDPTLERLKRISIQNTEKDPVFGDTARLFQGFTAIFDKLQCGYQASDIKGVVVKGKIFGNPVMEGRLRTHFLSGKLKHVRRGIQTGDVKTHPDKHLQVPAGTATNIQHPFTDHRPEQLDKQIVFQFRYKPVPLAVKPLVIVASGFEIKYISHRFSSSEKRPARIAPPKDLMRFSKHFAHPFILELSI